MSDYPSVALLGPGAIGTTIAAALYEAGRLPLLCGRTPHAHLTLRHDEGEIRVPGPVLIDPAAISRPVALLFVAVKTTQVTQSAGWLQRLCDENTVVCALQNGIEQQAQLQPLVNCAQVMPSVVWFPAQREADASVWLRARPRLTLPDTPAAASIAAALSGTRCSTDLSADFHSVAWRKLLQNAVAGLMVLTNRRAGMFSRQDIAELALAYLNEALGVARACGATLSDSVTHDILAGLQSAPADLSTFILADRQAGRPLEWECRNGVIQRYGRSKGVPTPLSDIIVPLLAAASEGPG